jgi:hypothetical protein
MPVSISGTNGVTFPDSSLQAAAASPYVLKNRIINGDMRIDQRNAGASVANNISGIQYSLDRWLIYGSVASKFTVQQNAGSVTPPAGFTNYLGVTSSAATSVGAGDIYEFVQYIEGYNVADLGWGTANAKTITISFWVRSSLTGTFGGSLLNGSSNRSYPYTYTISSANTWEQKTITIPGDTTGTWLTNNDTGLRVFWSLGVGSTYSSTAGSWQAGGYYSPTGATSVVGTSGATFYITGVQLEIGSTATPFERRLYNQELANCQRYCYVLGGGALYERIATGGWWNSTTLSFPNISLPVTMRSASGITVSYSSLSHFDIAAGQTGLNPTSIALDSAPNGNLLCLSVNVASGGTTGAVANLYADNSLSARLYVTCEL